MKKMWLCFVLTLFAVISLINVNPVMAEAEGQIIVSEVDANKGENATVVISISDDVTAMAMAFSIVFDPNVLEYEPVAIGQKNYSRLNNNFALTVNESESGTGKLTFVLDSAENVYSIGDVVSITIKVKENAPSGIARISAGFIDASYLDDSYDVIDFTMSTVSGGVNILSDGYTVTWKNDDGTVLETDTGVAEGTIPSYDSEEPSKEADSQYIYTFAGWTPEIAPVTGDVTYTAKYEAKAKVSYTVTFKVVNGSWNDSTAADKTVTLEGYEGDELKLTADQIPAAGSQPSDTYKEGAWNTEPSADTVISADTTHTYIYTAKEVQSYTVTFKVVNGSWNDSSSADKTVKLEGYEGDELKLTADQIPAAGSQPADAYKEGAWDTTPSADTVISEDTTYTYTYTSKEAQSWTVTFKVVNGSWNDSSSADKTVTLEGYEGDELKLTVGQIPAAGSQPADTYKEGAWDTTPSADTVISADTTYTYTYTAKEAQSWTVTFRVVNGSWNDSSSEDKTVKLEGYEGDELKLTAGQIPAAGSQPADTYKEGAWDTTPSADTVISVDMTYTYTYCATKTISVMPLATKVVIEDAGDGTKKIDCINKDHNTYQLHATVLPVESEIPVKWTSSSKKIATVDENGLVTAVKPGTVTIKATATDGSKKSASVKIRVVAKVQTGSLTISKSVDELHAKKKATFKVSFTQAFPPGNKKVKWMSSDESLATVTSKGVVKGVGNGTVTITACSVEKPDECASHDVLIIPYVSTVTLNDEEENKTLTIDVVTKGTDAQKLTYQLSASYAPTEARSGIKWTSSSSKIATVTQNGLVTAVKPGTVTIKATATDGSKKYAAVKIKVISTVQNGSLSISGYNSVKLKKTITLKPKFDQAVQPTNRRVTWTLSDTVTGTDVATVSAKGVVKGLSDGVVIIQACSVESPDICATKEITVGTPAGTSAIEETELITEPVIEEVPDVEEVPAVEGPADGIADTEPAAEAPVETTEPAPEVTEEATVEPETEGIPVITIAGDEIEAEAGSEIAFDWNRVDAGNLGFESLKISVKDESVAEPDAEQSFESILEDGLRIRALAEGETKLVIASAADETVFAEIAIRVTAPVIEETPAEEPEQIEEEIPEETPVEVIEEPISDSPVEDEEFEEIFPEEISWEEPEYEEAEIQEESF